MFTHRQIVFQMLLMHSAKGPQEISRRGPQPLDGIDMNLADSIAIIIARPFVLTMTDRAVGALDLVGAQPFIRVTSGSLLRVAMHVLLQSLAVRMLANSQAALPAPSAKSADHRRAMIVVSSVPTLLVRSPPGRIIGIGVLVAFFPPRCGNISSVSVSESRRAV